MALAAHAKRAKKHRSAKKRRSDGSSDKESDKECENCHRPGHRKLECWSKGGRKEGQGPWQNNKRKRAEAATIAASNNEDDELFAFTCTSDYDDVAKAL